MVFIATFAGGCFWGMQAWFNKEFGDAIVKSAVGYIGGGTNSPTYHNVCKGTTGHAEALQLEFNPDKVSYEKLCEYFFRIHDPTTLNRQGNDSGSQYRSAIFPHDTEQKRTAEAVLKKMNDTRYEGNIVTTIEEVPVDAFHIAEPNHQNYLETNPGGYCNHRPRW